MSSNLLCHDGIACQNERQSDDGAKAGKPAQAGELLDRLSALRNHRIRFQDAIDQNAERVTTIQDHDIVFGRGKGFQNRSGNKRMRQIIDKYKEQYSCSKRSQKRDLVQAVYREIVEGGARFLTKPTATTADFFVVVDDEIALQKVSNTIRCKKSCTRKSGSLQCTRLAHQSREGFNVAGNTKSTSAMMASHSEAPLNLGVASLSGLPLSLNALPLSTDVLGPADGLQLARFNGYQATFGGMPQLSCFHASPSSFEYYDILRREVALRDALMLQHLEGAQNLGAARLGSALMLSRGTSKVPLNTATQHVFDESNQR